MSSRLQLSSVGLGPEREWNMDVETLGNARV